jgi:beta-galactosidase
MTHEENTAGSFTRRTLLGQAAGAAGLLSALGNAGRSEAQTQSSARTRETFDFDWKFNKGDAPGAQEPGFADTAWRSLDVPHDWSIEGPYGQKETAQGSLPTGIGWYRKRFRLPESSRGKKAFIEFDGVFENSEVWINGQYLGKRPFGYIGFSYDMTPHVRFGASENVIAVKVDNSNQPNSRWYTGSGIYRHTWLLVTNNVHVAEWGTFVTTPQVSAAAASVQVKTRVRNDGKATAKCTLATSLLDKDGKEVQTVEVSQDVAANGEYEFVQLMKVEKPNLWSVETPYMYQVRSTVRDQSGVVDVYDTPMGIREAIFDADKGFLLNGQRVKIKGVCLHHDAGAVGAAVPERVLERRLEILKAMGCNGIRTSHNPYSPERGIRRVAVLQDAQQRLCALLQRLVRAGRDRLRAPRPESPLGGPVERGQRGRGPGRGQRRGDAETASHRVPQGRPHASGDRGLRSDRVGTAYQPCSPRVPGALGCGRL